MPERSQAVALIAAAGSGERLGAGGPKALVELAGRPLVAWCLAAFRESRTVGRIVIAAPAQHLESFRARVPAGEAEVVAGGAARSASVAAALASVAEPEAIVAVHDAARPLVSAGLIDACVERLAATPEASGVIAATPITDTVKRAADPRVRSGADAVHRVVSTEDRDYLWAAQTPQVFRAPALREALAAEPEELAAASDDAMLVERAGGTIVIEPAPASNLKVTTPDDLRLAELLVGG